MTAATIEKEWELLVFLHAGAIRWISCKFYEIHWKSRNSMKMLKFYGKHEVSWNSLISWIPRPFTKPLYSLLKIKVWAAWTPQNIKNIQNSINSSKSQNFHYFPQKSLENLQNDAKISFWRILVVPCPPHPETLNIPIGLSRFPARDRLGRLKTHKIWFCN